MREWYNFRTGEHDQLATPPQDYADYISQSPTAQNMYACLVEDMNVLPSDAALQVLAASVLAENQTIAWEDENG